MDILKFIIFGIQNLALFGNPVTISKDEVILE